MTTATAPQRQLCDSCGKRPRMAGPNEDERCVTCEMRSVEADVYGAEMTLEVLLPALCEALTRIAPSDLHVCVAEAVRRTGCDGAPTIADRVAEMRRLSAIEDGEGPA
jgi:hypothetical protein